MSLPVFPTFAGLTWPVDKASGFATLKQTAANKLTTTVSQSYNPFWTWDLTLEVLDDAAGGGGAGQARITDLRRLQGFYALASGAGGEFLLNDPYDNYVGPALLPGTATPNVPMAQLSVVNDGAATPTFYSPLQRNLGGLFLEDMTDLNGALAVYDNGVLKTLGTDYSVIGPGLALPGAAYMGLALQWGAAPTGPVTAEFGFYFRVRFADDSATFSQFTASLWTVGGSEASSGGSLHLESARPVQV